MANHNDASKTTLKKPNKKPTIKQQKALINLVENGGNVGKAMRDAGYSAAMVKNPQKFTGSEYVQVMMAKVGFNDIDGFQLLKDGMNSTKTIVMGDKEDSFVDIQPDYPTRHKYLETFLRVRGIGHQSDVGSGGIHFHNHTEQVRDTYDI